MSNTFSADGPWAANWPWDRNRQHGRDCGRSQRHERGTERGERGRSRREHHEHHSHGGRRGPGGSPMAERLAMAARYGGWQPPRGFDGFAELGRAFEEMRHEFGGFGGRPGRRGRRVGRGDVRAGILLLLAEEPRNGYQIIQELGRRSNGLWRPSPGSIYPALSQLEDEELVEQFTGEGEARRQFRLTEAGSRYVEEHRNDLKPPWESISDSTDDGLTELRDLLAQTSFAAVQVARAGSEAQVGAAKALLDETRRSLYRILADGDQPQSSADDDNTDPQDAPDDEH